MALLVKSHLPAHWFKHLNTSQKVMDSTSARDIDFFSLLMMLVIDEVQNKLFSLLERRGQNVTQQF